METFTPAQRAYLASQSLGRLATVAPDGQPQNNPVTFVVRADDSIDIGGYRMGVTKKYRNVEAGQTKVAFVVDDVVSVQPWQARMLEIRGTAVALRDVEPPLPGMTGDVIRIYPDRIIAFGLDE